MTMSKTQLISGQPPVVSIGLPVYNGANFLAQALESILAQDMGDFELIISDNGSTDETPDICARYAARDSRIHWQRQPSNMGAAKNYNLVFRLASARYFKWAAHDDLLMPQFLSHCIAAFETSANVPALVYPRSDFIDESGQVLRPDPATMHTGSAYPAVRVFRAIQGMSKVTSVFGLFHRDTLARTRLIGNYISSDYVLLVECALLGNIMHLEGAPLFQRRFHQKMSVQANKTDQEVLRWFDPEARSKLTAQQRLYLEYLRSVYSIGGLTGFQRQLCAVSLISSVLSRRARVTAGRWRRQLFPHA